MEIFNENNLSICEFQDVNELNTEELEAIAGGIDWGNAWDKFEGGVKHFGKGLKDHSAESPSRYDDLWYNLGYSTSDLIPG
jgi:hypothetical protein